jgi:hypothetical protein
MVKATQRKVAKVVKLGVSASSIKIAEALTKSFPTQAGSIVRIMSGAATSRSMKRKLERVQLALDSLQKGAQK